MGKKKVYVDARLRVVQLSGKSQLLAGSDPATNGAPQINVGLNAMDNEIVTEF